MKNHDIYDAVTQIDDQFIESADNLRNNARRVNADTRTGGSRSVISLRAMSAISAAALAVVFLIAVVAVLTLKGREQKSSGQTGNAVADPVIISETERPPVVTPGGNTTPIPDHPELVFPDDGGFIKALPDDGFFEAHTVKADFLSWIPVGITDNCCFDKNSPIIVSFIIEFQQDPHFGLEFVDAVNTYSRVYRTYVVEGRQCFDVMFYASPDANGSLTIRLIPPEDRTHHTNGLSRTIYTANSSDKTFISTASMETAMELAGLYVSQGGTEYGTVYAPGPANDASGRMTITGTVEYLDDNGSRQPVDGVYIDIYKLTPDSELIAVTTVEVKNGCYSAELDVDLPDGNIIIRTPRVAGAASPEDLALLENKGGNVLKNNVSSGSTLKDRFIFGRLEGLDDYEKVPA